MIAQILWILQNCLVMFWSILKVRLGFRYPKDPIPTGLYCYRMVEVPSRTNNYNGKYTHCPYYVHLGGSTNGCKYVGRITGDPSFDDQCKICSVKREFEAKNS